MWRRNLFILFGLIISCQANQPHTVTAPRYIKLDTPTTIVVNLHGVGGAVNIVGNLKFKLENIGGSTPIAEVAGAPATEPIEISIQHLRNNYARENRKQYVEVELTANPGNIKLPTVKIEIKDETGYIEIMTDRPVYRPNEMVKYRVICMDQDTNPDTNREVEIIVQIPPDRIGVSRKVKMMPQNKFIHEEYELSQFPEFGTWRIQAKYVEEGRIIKATRDFSVQEYVIPSFNVDLSLPQSYILTNGDPRIEEITVNAKIEYSYGEKVSGNYYLVAYLVRPGEDGKESFYKEPDTLDRQRSFIDGAFTVVIPIQNLHDILRDGETFETLEGIGATVVIEVTAVNNDDGAVEATISSPMHFTPSPYKIDISRMSTYFTPGLTFPIKADVIDFVTGQPVSGVEVKIHVAGEILERTSDDNGQIYYTHSMPNNKNPQQIQIVTDSIRLGPNEQARKVFTVNPYNSPTSNFIQLTSRLQIAEVGQNFEIKSFFGAWNPNRGKLRYVVLSRGEIVLSGAVSPNPNVVQIAFDVPVTHAMVPSMRIIAYYKLPDGEIVANSLWVDVKDEFKAELVLNVIEEEVTPGSDFTVSYQGGPNALINVAAVDRGAYFLFNESRLSRSEFFDKMDAYDLGCMRQGGMDGKHVFEVSGFQIVGGNVPRKEEFPPACDGSNRKRRSLSGTCGKPTIPRNGYISPNQNSYDVNKQVTFSCKSGFVIKGVETTSCQGNGEWRGELPTCVLDVPENCLTHATVENLANVNCERRAKKVRDGILEAELAAECGSAFYKACVAAVRSRTKGRPNMRTRARSVAENQKNRLKRGVLRNDFRENMIFEEYQLDNQGQLTIPYKAVDSITTFEFDAVSLHRTDGFSIARTDFLKIFKNVFIKLRLPYALKVMEQVDMRVTVFNYGDEQVDATLYVKIGNHLCSHFKTDRSSWLQDIIIPPKSAKSASFAIQPLRVPPKNEDGKVMITVKGLDNMKQETFDEVEHKIPVESEGIVRRDVRGTKLFDMEDGPLNYNIAINFPPEVVPETAECTLYAYSGYMGPVIQMDAVTNQPRDIAKLMRIPHGCGEQTMVYTGPTVFAFKYLRSVGKMPVGSPEEQAALQKIDQGYGRSLSYRSDHVQKKAWAVWANAAPSMWLNAFVNKVYARAQQCNPNMDIVPIIDSLEWTLTQQDDSGFYNTGHRVYHREMHGAVGGPLTLTAYVVISLLECRHLYEDRNDLKMRILASKEKAVQYLKNNRNNPQMETPYVLALTAYALQLDNIADPFTTEIFRRLMAKKVLSPDARLISWTGASLAQVDAAGIHNYWYKTKPSAVSVETTGYALLAYLHKVKSSAEVSQDDIYNLKKIAAWLIEQRDENGAFTTTQDTVIGLQALTEYMIWSQQYSPPDNDIALDVTYTGEARTDWEHGHAVFLDNKNENYTEPLTIPENVVNNNNIAVSVRGTGKGTISYRCTYRISANTELCQFELGITTEKLSERNEDFKLTITAAKPEGDPTGQAIIEINLVTGFTPLLNSLEQISRTFQLDGVVERFEVTNQNIFLYLDTIDAEGVEFAIIMQNVMRTRNSEPVSISVYDYYEPLIRCTKFYNKPNERADLRTTKACRGPRGDGENMCECAEGGCPRCRYRDLQLTTTQCIGTAGACNICKLSNQLACFNLREKACQSSFVYVFKITKQVESTDENGVLVEIEGEVVDVIKQGSDVEVKNQRRKFKMRRDCYESCRDPLLVDPARSDQPTNEMMFPEGELVTVFGNAKEQKLEKNGVAFTQYLLQSGSFFERTIPKNVCDRSQRNKLKNKCDIMGKNDKCDKILRIIQSCETMTNLKKIIDTQGCDEFFNNNK